MKKVPLRIVSAVLGLLTMAVMLFCLYGIGILQYHGLYQATPKALRQEYQEEARRKNEEKALEIATRYASSYSAQYKGMCSQAVAQALYGDLTAEARNNWNIRLKDASVTVSSIQAHQGEYEEFEFTLSVTFPRAHKSYADIIAPLGPVGDEPYPSYINVVEKGIPVTYSLLYTASPTYQITVQMATQAQNSPPWAYLEPLYAQRNTLVIVAMVSMAMLMGTMFALASTFGKEGRRPRGLNRLPLDLYGTILGWGIALISIWAYSWILYLYGGVLSWQPLLPAAALVAAAALGCWLFAMAATAQYRVHKGYWWRNSLIWRICRGIWWMLGILWQTIKMFPLIWRWMLIGVTLTAGFLLSFWASVVFGSGFYFLFLLTVLLWLAVVCYAGYAMGTLLRRTRGRDTTTPIDNLLGNYQQLAEEIDTLSQKAMVAAQQQLRSERMKAELITNVSHDLKTPLTSIINYVDLLQKPHDPDSQVQYLEVLSRQSQRLKNMIENLMEMSKATTGNLVVEITRLDAVEAVNQALGEFSGRLADAGLTPIFSPPPQPMSILADSRLVWRVLNNLLDNAVKYAQPGTRVYFQLDADDNTVKLCMKNISAAQLNISAEELMERFVRGDASRNTEGSGLGLNIGKTLMEVQKGELGLEVDGDLFKLTLTFPAAE